ncbi:unnamed protein product [Symbiodinium natans]|uniref:Uncharacterized protein n=1 Tax=Symbiodinium natans TaxID=878477 RepID=A0A812UH94_9DINO|nr:unnamed protein product [Symbiodinium natans]
MTRAAASTSYGYSNGAGKYPAEDPWGRSFSKEYCPDRFKLAHQPLVTKRGGAAFAIFDGLQADLEFVKKVLFLQSCLAGREKLLLQQIKKPCCQNLKLQTLETSIFPPDIYM